MAFVNIVDPDQPVMPHTPIMIYTIQLLLTQTCYYVSFNYTTVRRGRYAGGSETTLFRNANVCISPSTGEVWCDELAGYRFDRGVPINFKMSILLL